MDYEQWEQILNTINDDSDLNGNNVVEKIKEKLQTIDSGEYQEWEKKGFDINFQFRCDFCSKVTLLHMSAYSGRCKGVVQYLLENGADIEAKDSSGKTALHLAAVKGEKDIVEYLIEKGADINARTKSSTRANSGFTALHFAAADGKKDIVQSLVERGADIDAKNGISFTPLHYAAFQGKTAVCAYLIERGADVNAKTIGNKTARDLAKNYETKQLIWKTGRSFTGICMAIGLFLGLSTAYLTGSTTLTPVGAVVGVFLAAAALGTLVGYGFAKVSQKFSIESAIQHYNQPSVA